MFASKIFRVDFNKDHSVSAKEMQRWIMEKTEEHFQEAMMENKNSFRAVDPDGDGEGGKQKSVSHPAVDTRSQTYKEPLWWNLSPFVSRFFRRSRDVGRIQGQVFGQQRLQ